MVARRKRSSLLVAIGAVLALGGGLAYAGDLLPQSIPARAILGCVQHPGGLVRIVNSPAQCTKTESLVTFAAPPKPAVQTVNCGAGQRLQQAIDAADATQPLTITVVGTCAGPIEISRDQVTLQAVSGDGVISGGVTVAAQRVHLKGLTVTTASGNNSGFALYLVGGATTVSNSHVEGSVHVEASTQAGFENVTIDHCGQLGDGFPPPGLQATVGAVVEFDGGSITGCANANVQAVSGAHLWLNGVTISGGDRRGVDVETGATALLTNDTVTNNGGDEGITDDGGSVTLNNTTVSGSSVGLGVHNGGSAAITNGSDVTGNGQGVEVSTGSHLVIGSDGAGDGAVDGNDGIGVRLVAGSTLQISDHGDVKNNGADGISLSDTSVAVLVDPNVQGNGGWGVHCDPAPSVAVERGPTTHVTGNTAGQVDCQNAGQPG